MFAVAAAYGCAQPVPDTKPDISETEKPADTLESRLAKVDSLMAQVTSLTDEYVRPQATMTDKRRLDALEYGEEARTILIDLQDKYPGNEKIEKRLKRACNLLEFLKRN